MQFGRPRPACRDRNAREYLVNAPGLVHRGFSRTSQSRRVSASRSRREQQPAAADRSGDGVVRPAAHGDRGDGAAGGGPAHGDRPRGPAPHRWHRPGDVPLRRRQSVRPAAAQPPAPRVAARVRAGPGARVHAGADRDPRAQAGGPPRHRDTRHRDVRARRVRAAAVAGTGRRPRRPAHRHRLVAPLPITPPVWTLRSGLPVSTPVSSTPTGATRRCAPRGPTATSRRSSSATSAASASGTAYAALRRSPRARHPARRHRRRPPAGLAAGPPARIGAVHR